MSASTSSVSVLVSHTSVSFKLNGLHQEERPEHIVYDWTVTDISVTPLPTPLSHPHTHPPSLCFGVEQAATAATLAAMTHALHPSQAQTPPSNASYGAEVAAGGSVEGGTGTIGVGWQERFVSCGGLDTLVELLLTREWDADGYDGRERGASGEGLGLPLSDSRVGVSLACQSLLAELVGRFMEGGFLPTRWGERQSRLVSRESRVASARVRRV